jgi:DNA-binding LytR/AlgR family response regulator
MWHEAGGTIREAIIRTPLKELAAQLDATQFAQVHRSVIVNLSSIARVVRGPNETAHVYLKGRSPSAAGEPQLPASVSPDVNNP